MADDKKRRRFDWRMDASCWLVSRNLLDGGVIESPVPLWASDDAYVGIGMGDMRKQIEQVGENLKRALSAAGCSLADLISQSRLTSPTSTSSSSTPM